MKKYKAFLTDCDGCLTDGGMYYTENGDELKKFNTKDGMGFKILKDRGVLTGVITGEDMKLNDRRFTKLNIDIVRQGVNDKIQILNQICQKYNIRYDEVVYVGDDINDMECIKKVGLGCSVNDGIKSVKESAKYVTTANGGCGAIREIIDMLIEEGKI